MALWGLLSKMRYLPLEPFKHRFNKAYSVLPHEQNETFFIDILLDIHKQRIEIHGTNVGISGYPKRIEILLCDLYKLELKKQFPQSM